MSLLKRIEQGQGNPNGSADADGDNRSRVNDVAGTPGCGSGRRHTT